MSQSLTYVEIEIDVCALSYGLSPCTAALYVTGTTQCHNSAKTCQDRASLITERQTLRFAIDSGYLPDDIEAIPNLESVDFSPGRISLGSDLGERASLTVKFRDHKWSDTGVAGDPYLGERPQDYDPYETGTFWGKFRARFPFLRGRPLRLIRGTLGQTLEQMTTRHYIIDSFNGPTPSGEFSIVAKDILKLLDGDRAQAPRLSNGFLLSDVASGDGSATLSPAGIGDIEYPASGYVAIGGQEICAFTRSGDALTLDRAEKNTEAQDHSAGDRVQLCLEFVSADPADIIATLAEDYAGVDSSFIPLDAWKTETGSYLQQVYSPFIAEPTSVKQLIGELIEQAALAMWWDDEGQKIRLQVLRNIPTTAARFSEENYDEGSLDSREQPDTRISQVWTYFALRNPLEPLDNADNYRSTAIRADLDAEQDYGSPAIKKIFSRFIPFGGRSIANRLNDLQLGRFRDPPRRFNFDVFPEGIDVSPVLGSGYRLEGWPIQDELGMPTDAPIQLTRIKRDADLISVEAEEVLFTQFNPEDITGRVIIIDTPAYNIDLRTLHDTLYPAPTDDDVSAGVNLTIIIEESVVVGSASTSLPALEIGTEGVDWPTGFIITVRVVGRTQGKGGQGADGPMSANTNGLTGNPGGTAIRTRHPIYVECSDGEIWGGGGGGGSGGTLNNAAAGSGGGGGGAGTDPGDGGAGSSVGGFHGRPGAAGSAIDGGAGGEGKSTSPPPNRGGDGGNGGGPGLPGENGGLPIPNPGGVSGGAGGAAGASIDGISFVTFSESDHGDIRGPTTG